MKPQPEPVEVCPKTEGAEDPGVPRGMGADWGNYSLIHDYSTDQYVFEIHLAVDLGSDKTAEDMKKLLEDDIASGDWEAKKFKAKLCEHLVTSKKMNESKRRLINAILLKPKK